MRGFHFAATAALSLMLAACGASTGGGASAPALAGNGKPKVPNTETRAGTQQHVVLQSNVDGVDVSFEVFEPDQLVAGRTYPLVLQGHGYGGSRQTTRDGFIGRLTAAGYYVISIDQRGFGESGGQVRVMDPDYEGQDLIEILDWAEDLPGLRRRSTGDMMVGSFGGSYGGMYQLLLAGVDPKHRLRVLAPDITPHDLTFSLDPNNVVKSGWGLALSAGGEAHTATELLAGTIPAGTTQDKAIYEILLSAVTSNSFNDSGLNFFKYHSVAYFCDGQAAGPQSFLLATPDPLNVEPTAYPPLDVLLTQGFRDTLFNVDDGLRNYQCLKARGGDVRLLTHQSGHILPVALPDSAQDALDPFAVALTIPEFQDAGGSRSCGSLVLDDVQFAWFQEKLNGVKGAVDQALPTGKDVCLSLAEGDAVSSHDMKVGGNEFDVSTTIPEFNSVLGVPGAVLGNGAREALMATLPLYTAPAGGAILAGVPTMSIDFGQLGAGTDSCTLPIGVGGCDPILFIGIGEQKAGTQRWDLVDDQLTPLRGFGSHEGWMTGVAERLAEGDKLALLVYAFHAQYPVTWSRDVIVPGVKFTGSVQLPLLAPGDVVKDGV